MKRAEAIWQVGVLALVFLTTFGVYVMLGLAWTRLREQRDPAGQATPFRSGAAVQILEPLDGAVLQDGGSLPVQAALLEPGLVRADLQVDGIVVGSRANTDPQPAAWTVDWTWEEAGEGSHVLRVQAHGLSGDVQVSAPVTVTVVPAGELVFASNRGGEYAVYAMQTDGRAATLLTSGPGAARQPAMRGDGLLAFVADTGAGGAAIRKSEGQQPGEQDLVAGRDPAWSPDGARLAYAASADGVSQVFVAGAGGEEPFQVTAEEVYAGQPAWSPDGTRLAYVADRDGNLDIWTVSPDGSQPYRLTDGVARDWAPAWSPDGSRLAFISDRGGSYQIYLMRADGAEVHPLTDLARGAESPRWSPDGFWLAFAAYTGDGTGVDAREIYVMRADGLQPVRLTRNSFDDTEPDWVRRP